MQKVMQVQPTDSSYGNASISKCWMHPLWLIPNTPPKCRSKFSVKTAF